MDKHWKINNAVKRHSAFHGIPWEKSFKLLIVRYHNSLVKRANFRGNK